MYIKKSSLYLLLYIVDLRLEISHIYDHTFREKENLELNQEKTKKNEKRIEELDLKIS